MTIYPTEKNNKKDQNKGKTERNTGQNQTRQMIKTENKSKQKQLWKQERHKSKGVTVRKKKAVSWNGLPRLSRTEQSAAQYEGTALSPAARFRHCADKTNLPPILVAAAADFSLRGEGIYFIHSFQAFLSFFKYFPPWTCLKMCSCDKTVAHMTVQGKVKHIWMLNKKYVNKVYFDASQRCGERRHLGGGAASVSDEEARRSSYSTLTPNFSVFSK